MMLFSANSLPIHKYEFKPKLADRGPTAHCRSTAQDPIFHSFGHIIIFGWPLALHTGVLSFLKFSVTTTLTRLLSVAETLDFRLLIP